MITLNEKGGVGVGEEEDEEGGGREQARAIDKREDIRGRHEKAVFSLIV